jgi:hypothetical protein
MNEVYYTNVENEGYESYKQHIWTFNSPLYREGDFAINLKKEKRKEEFTDTKGFISYITNSKNIIYLKDVK